MSQFLPEAPKTTDSGIEPVAASNIPDANIQLTDKVVKTMLAKPQQFVDPLMAYITDAIQVGNLIIPAGQIFGLPTNTVRNYKKSTSSQDVVNTASATDVLSEIIPANTMGGTGSIRVRMNADYLNNSGASRDLTVTISFGGTTIWSSISGGGGGTITASATRRVMLLDFVLNNLTPSSQFMGGFFFLGGTSAASTGLGQINTSGDRATGLSTNGTVAIDTTKDQTLKVTVTHSVANASLSFRRQYYMIELI